MEKKAKSKTAKMLLVGLLITFLISTSFLLLLDFNTYDFKMLTDPIELNKDLSGVVGYCVYQLDDKSLVLNSANNSGTYLTKLDSNNNILWIKLIYTGHPGLSRLLPASDGGFLLGGISGNRYVLVKTDPSGSIEWTKNLDSGAPVNYLMDINEAVDDGFVLAGFGEPAEDSLGWIWFAKTNFEGDLLWSRNISGPVSDCPSKIVKANVDGYVLSDTSYSFVPDQAFFRIISLDTEGNVLGNYSYGGYGYYYQPECNGAIATDDGGYLLFGYLWRKEAWVVKVDADGVMQWNQTYGQAYCSITGALQTPNGYLLQEYLNNNCTSLILIDKTGNQLWNTTWADVTMPVGMEANFHSILKTKDSGYIMVASKNNSVWLANFDYPKEVSSWFWFLIVAEIMLILTLIVLVIKVLKKS
ncbi:MAG: hypothetical protein PHY74_01420 [Candidatus Bathyarchaeota archaeon]|nr:hypothetical protein [Candidatus Bathyarchaeota archaeon]MDD4325460.1 hypothetical protein [Candidatus Bathyarchaeota archaeon]